MKTLSIYGKEQKRKSDGGKFVTYSYIKSLKEPLKLANGKELHTEKFEVKFTRECETTPKGIGFYLIEVDEKDISIQQPQKTGWKRTIWIKKAKSVTKDAFKDEELAQKRMAEIDEL